MTAWLLDPVQDHRMAELRARPDPSAPTGVWGDGPGRPTVRLFARLLANKGWSTKPSAPSVTGRRGLSILEIPERERAETFADWADRIGDPFAGGHDVIYQMPFAHDGVSRRGRLVLRVADEETGQVSYEPVDAKLARFGSKPGHVLQLCFYAEAIEALTGVAPQRMHLWLGSGDVEPIRTNDVMPYWAHLRSGFHELMSEEGAKADTTPVPATTARSRDFEAMCEARWRSEDVVHLVANVRTVDLPALEANGIEMLADLADAHPGAEVEGIDPDRLAQMSIQAEATGSPRLRGRGAAVSIHRRG